MLEAEFKRLKEILKAKKAKSAIILSNTRYSIILDGNIFVEDKYTGDQIKWFQAFGNKSIVDILKYFKIEKIILTVKDKEYNFKDIQEVIAFLE